MSRVSGAHARRGDSARAMHTRRQVGGRQRVRLAKQFDAWQARCKRQAAVADGRRRRRRMPPSTHRRRTLFVRLVAQQLRALLQQRLNLRARSSAMAAVSPWRARTPSHLLFQRQLRLAAAAAAAAALLRPF
jgi:hypothetical protein